jgi:hypothetical protein
MAIPEAQLETWSHRGAIQGSKATHESIRNALNQYKDYSQRINFDIYLHGSYKNDTNIRGDSDVDVVVELKDSFQRDISSLPQNEQHLYLDYYKDATYKWEHFRSDILKALQEYYGNSMIEEGRKSLKVYDPNGGRLPADVVVCMEYRDYLRFLGANDQKFIQGMTFYVPNENRWIISYPKLHDENSTKKNSQFATNGLYKSVVRIFKNAREYLLDNKKISSDLAPSYFIEGLLYNVPNDKFKTNFSTTVYNILYWLNNEDYGQFVCPNERLYLFGDSPEQWSETNAKQYLSSIINLWNGW